MFAIIFTWTARINHQHNSLQSEFAIHKPLATGIYITTFVFQIAFPLFRARNFSEKRREGSGWQRFARHGRKAKIRRLIG